MNGHKVERRYVDRWVTVAHGSRMACERIARKIRAVGSRARVRKLVA